MIFVTINIHSIQNIKNKVTDFFLFSCQKISVYNKSCWFSSLKICLRKLSKSTKNIKIEQKH